MRKILSKKELNDIFEWDVINWSKSLNFWNLENTFIKEKKVLTIGERNGGISLLFSMFEGKVTATDLNGITEEGKEIHKKYKVNKFIEYKNADVLQLPFDENTFDIVGFKSVLGGLRDRSKQFIAVNEIYRVLKPGGVLYFAENLTSSKIHQFLRQRFVRWGNSWMYLDYEKKDELFAKFKSAEFSSYGFLGILGFNKILRNLFSWFDKIVMPIIPSNKRYILFGKCIK